MNIVAVAACTTGLAHTYIAREKLVKAAEARGHTIKCETQGSIGIENELTVADVAAADVVVLAIDVAIDKMERFSGKPTVKVGTSEVVKNPTAFVQKIERAMAKRGVK